MSKYKFQQLAPTPARGKFDPKLYTDPDWWAEEKYDGDRRIAQFVDGRVRFTGRRISDKDGLFVEKTDNLPHLNTYVNRSLHGTVLDGEMICTWPGARSKDVTSIMGSLPAKAIAKQEDRGWLTYVVFDCLFYMGIDRRDEPLIARRSLVEMILDTGWSNEHVMIAKRVPSSKAEGFCAGIWECGGEGVILKHRLSKYSEEKKWVKVKREDTEDVVIMGYADPEKMTEKTESYTDANGIKKKRVLETSESRLHKNGWIGAVKFGQYVKGKLVDCGQCSGMDDEIRAELSNNKEKYIGQVIEILSNEREQDTGKFRHPRFVKFRPDKNAKDCIWRKS